MCVGIHEQECIIRHIENADATPPHLEVILHFGSSGGVHGSLQFFAFGLLSLFSIFECCGPLRHHERDEFAVWALIFDRFLIILGCGRARGHCSGPLLANVT